jgi:phosphoglycerate dehydrogenase-like enzyme
MRTVAYDPYVTAERMAELGAEQAESIEAALEVADVVSLHLPVTRTRAG